MTKVSLISTRQVNKQKVIDYFKGNTSYISPHDTGIYSKIIFVKKDKTERFIVKNVLIRREVKDAIGNWILIDKYNTKTVVVTELGLS